MRTHSHLGSGIKKQVVIFAEGRKFRMCRPGYEKYVVYDILEKGENKFFVCQIISIRTRLSIDNILCIVMTLLIPDSNYGLLKKIIKIILSGVWESY